MTALLRLAVAAVLCIGGFGGAFALLQSDGLRPELAPAAPERSQRDGEDPLTAVERSLPALPTDAAGALWGALRLPLLLGVAALAAVIGVRVRSRRSRRYVRLRLLPYRADEATPEEVSRLLESWHQQLVARWYRRPFRGQPSIALELLAAPDRRGGTELRLAIVCPEGSVEAIEGSLLACYPDSRIEGEQPLPNVEHVVRLKKRDPFISALHCPETYERNLIDALAQQATKLDEAAIVQYVLTPAPGLFDRRSRRLFTARERSNRRWSRDVDPARSEVLAKELRGGLSVQHRPLFFSEIRVGAMSVSGARALAGVLRGGSTGENRLTERRMRPWARGPLYRSRLRLGCGNPLPSFRKGVLSSSELAGLWQLPSPGLTGVEVERSSIPRATAPPQINRQPEDALARDERGPVGIRSQDKTDGLGLIGGQKTGKTSLLCQTVKADAADDDCAVIVLMPKPGDARTALSLIPPHRTVHFLDFERPELGINPLLAVGDAAMVADKIVEAFRDINDEGDIRGSSDRFLRQAAQAAIGAGRVGALESPPSLWDMYRMLLPSEVAFREHVVHALYADARFTDTVTFFGRDLPNDLRDSLVNTTSKLDAPRNKLLRLLVESLDKVLRHPRQLSLDDVVRNREVLVVDGKMGTFGSGNCRVMMQFILNMLYGTLQRQQQLPEEQRVRVALKVDEAHLIINESFADALATLRSGGLEVVAAWQYGEQVQDPKIRAGLMSLLRQRCMFSMGESADAREMTEIAMNVYVDMIKDDPRSRSRVRLTPDVIYNLPNHHALCSWIDRGARMPAFIAQTFRLERDERMVEHHLAEQRASGGFVPDRMPDPLPEVEVDGIPEVAPVAAAEVEATATAVVAEVPRRKPALQPPPASAVPAPERAPQSFVELDLDDVRTASWEPVESKDTERQPEPTPRDLEVLVSLWRHRFLLASQIHRRWWSDSSTRACQQGMARMARAGWVRRLKLVTTERGSPRRVYCLTHEGLGLLQRHSGAQGRPRVPGDAEWADPQLTDVRALVRDLHVNGWVLALQGLAPRTVRHWRGPRESRLAPPRRRERGEWVPVRPEEITVGSSRRLHGLALDAFEPVSPDATVEVRAVGPERELRFDLMVHLVRGRGRRSLETELHRYDALITGWFRLVDRYQRLKAPPLVVLVCEDEERALACAKLADEQVTGQIAKAGTSDADWPFPGRRALFFAAERSVHEGSLEALQLPPRAPAARSHEDSALRRVQIVDPRLLGRG